jgi:hypothetical protein
MSFLEKCHFHHDSSKLYEKPRMSDPVFYVQHYAGRIKYNVSIKTLKLELIRQMFDEYSQLMKQTSIILYKNWKREILSLMVNVTGRPFLGEEQRHFEK